MFGKVVTKLIQSLPTWEVTKYYGRVCIYQLKCLKYKVQTSEAWFNFKCKFMPGSLRNEIECEEPVETKVKSECKQQQEQQKKACETTQSQNKLLRNSRGHKKSSTSISNLKDNYNIDQFVSNAKKQGKPGNKKHKENEDYPKHEDYVPKKQKKVKHAQ